MPEKQREAGMGGYLAIGIIGILIGPLYVGPDDHASRTVAAQTSSITQSVLNQPRTTPAAASFTTDPSTEKASSQTDVTTVYYARCADARAVGAAPIHKGEPGYAPHLDRDGDGVACE